MTDRKAFEEGMILALVSPPLPHVAKKEPIAYSYNGVVLPGLPEWDREKYPYVIIIARYIVNYSFMMTTYAYISSAPAAYFPDNITEGEKEYAGPFIKWDDDTEFLLYGIEWAENEEDWSPKDTTTLSDSCWAPLSTLNKRWANHDVVSTTDGAIYLSASEPVPVYE